MMLFGVMFYYCFIFFFSSRRRHTRLQGDWSSDVCSSDLLRKNARARSGAQCVMTVGNIVRSQVCQFAVHFLHCDWTVLDVDQAVRVALEISDDAVLSVNSDAIAVGIGKR